MTELPHVGFTGTRNGMTPAQIGTLRVLFPAHGWLHHGLCIGADKQAHDLARQLGLLVEGHPPLSDLWRFWAGCDVLNSPKDYIERNHDIVDATSALFGAPASFREEVRSGTWATIRYARLKHRPITLVLLDGSVRREGANT